MLQQIPQQHHEIVIQLSEDIETSNSLSFTSLSTDEQREIIEIAYKYLRYQQSEFRDPAITKRSFQLLKLRNKYPVSKPAKVPAPVSPDKGHGSKRTSFGLGKRLDNYYGEFGFKMSFHDLEDNAKDLYLGAEYRPFRTLNIRAYYNHSVKGPDHTALGTLPRDGIAPFEYTAWKSIRTGVLATVQIVNGLYARIGYEWRNVSGEQSYLDRWTPEEYHGKTGTFRIGLNYGF